MPVKPFKISPQGLRKGATVHDQRCCYACTVSGGRFGESVMNCVLWYDLSNWKGTWDVVHGM